MAGTDSLGVMVAREAQRQLAGQMTASWGVIATYDATTHTARVTLHPDQRQTAPLPFLIPFLGLAHPLIPGTQCIVLFMQGVEQAIAGVTYSPTDPVPEASTVLVGDVHVVGSFTSAGPLILGQGQVLPPPSAALRGALFLLSTTPDGEAGTADTLQVCLQAADGSLSWQTIATG